MAKPSNMTKVMVLLVGVFLVIDIVAIGYFWRSTSPQKYEEAPASASVVPSQSKGVSGKASSPARDVGEQPPKQKQPQPETREFLDELLGFVRDTGTKKSILFNGSEVIEVEGASIAEDPVTGKIYVRGLKRLEISDGTVLETSDDGTLSYDPATGRMGVEAKNSKVTPPPRR